MTTKRPAKKAKKKRTTLKKSAHPKKAANRRRHRRYRTDHLWVTEYTGDFQFTVPVINISEGGIFLKGRMKTEDAPSRMKLHFKDASMEVTAQPIYDCILKESYGTGYCFTELSKNEVKTLRELLRNLD